jgi:hypothetical protein
MTPADWIAGFVLIAVVVLMALDYSRQRPPADDLDLYDADDKIV